MAKVGTMSLPPKRRMYGITSGGDVRQQIQDLLACPRRQQSRRHQPHLRLLPLVDLRYATLARLRLRVDRDRDLLLVLLNDDARDDLAAIRHDDVRLELLVDDLRRIDDLAKQIGPRELLVRELLRNLAQVRPEDAALALRPDL